MPRPLATLTGFGAVLLWATLAPLTVLAAPLPPLQLTASAFLVGGLLGLAVRPGGLAAWAQRPRVWMLGVGGLAGYHLLYFAALTRAPAVEASLIAYLWPLLIVLLSAPATGERLRAHHLAGAFLGFLGAALIATRGGVAGLDPAALPGHVLALLAVIVWATYSVLSRRWAAGVPTEAVASFCLVAALACGAAHLAAEETVVPGPTQAAAMLALGAGPAGGAFYLWDVGVKHGDIFLLGVASYAAPVLSTLLLVALGMAPMSGAVAGACLLVTAGAAIASRDALRAPGLGPRGRRGSGRYR
jgi:drug/metabolite transporter (DMT)-like permease